MGTPDQRIEKQKSGLFVAKTPLILTLILKTHPPFPIQFFIWVDIGEITVLSWPFFRNLKCDHESRVIFSKESFCCRKKSMAALVKNVKMNLFHRCHITVVSNFVFFSKSLCSHWGDIFAEIGFL